MRVDINDCRVRSQTRQSIQSINLTKTGLQSVNVLEIRNTLLKCPSMSKYSQYVKVSQVCQSTPSMSNYPQYVKVKDRPVSPAEVAATVYHLMGLELETFLPAQLGRIVPLVDGNAKPIHELLS